MAKAKSLLPYGFKARAEKIALKYREELSLKPSDPLCGFKLAEHLKIAVFTAKDFFLDKSDLENIVGTDKSDRGWSALTMPTEKGNTIIIHNHLHAPARQQSNLMHELAHYICEHKQPELKYNVPLPAFMRPFQPKEEEEAKCLGATLQITREALVWAIKRKMKNDAIAEYFNASIDMVVYRINSTGVKKQLSYIR